MVSAIDSTYRDVSGVILYTLILSTSLIIRDFMEHISSGISNGNETTTKLISVATFLSLTIAVAMYQTRETKETYSSSRVM